MTAPAPTRNRVDRDQVIRLLDVGVAVVDGDGLLLFENASFFRWFPPHSGDTEKLSSRLPAADLNGALERLRRGVPAEFEVEVDADGRDLPIAVRLSEMPDDVAGAVLVEARDITRQKQAEYMLESYSKMSESNARALEREKERVERLLLNVMPRSVYAEMKDYGTVTPQLFENASILMVDFVDHTEKAISRDPAALVTALNDMFTVFDRITDLFGCERIRTVGDSYMAVSGLPEPTPDHAHNVARVALRMLRYIEKRNAAHSESWHCRVGINSGPVVGSLVGVQKYVYDIFGPGVNLAARMETLSEPMRITLSEDTYRLIGDDFACTELGEVDVKGFGAKKLYALDRELAKS